MKSKQTPIQDCTQDKVIKVINYFILAIFLIMVAYPFIYVISCSFSSGKALMNGQVKLFPVGFSLEGYKTVFAYNPLWTGYLNSLIYMVTGTAISLVVTVLAAYPLSRNEIRGKKIFMGLFLFTMMFNGGLVPTYILIKNLNIMNSLWAIVLPGAINAYNVIVARTFFKQTIPDELLEASKLDGCNDFRFLWSIVLPLSKPILAVLSLWVAVGLWNSYFNALIYLDDSSKFPLQLILRNILLIGNVDLTKQSGIDPAKLQQMKYLGEMLKYGTIVVSSLPLMIIYPFVQKYFVKGIMIGSVKG